MTVFVATIPIVSGKPKFLAGLDAQTDELGEEYFQVGGRRKDRIYLERGDENIFHMSGQDHSLVGKYLGRLDEGQFGTTGRPAVIVCTGSKGALNYLKNLAASDANYNFRSLKEVWQLTAVRNWLIANGMPVINGPFGPDPSINVRPRMPVVYCGQGNGDFFAPTE